jgi:ecotin
MTQVNRSGGRPRPASPVSAALIAAVRKIAAVALLLGLPVAGQTGGAPDDLSAFPQAEPGMVRYLLYLPARRDESVYKVELIVGKTLQTDSINRYFLGGEIRAESIPGWGYTRYLVDEVGPMAGTLMAVDPDAAKVERFITLGGPPYLVRYNSRLPIVIYVPQGVEARYRIWSAGDDIKAMSPG